MSTFYYWSGRPNAGDYFNEYLNNKLVLNLSLSNEPNYVICGSVLSFNEITENTRIFGSGFYNESDNIRCHNLNNYRIVRGKLTANKLGLKNCLLGDPGLCSSFLYNKKWPKKYKFSIACYYEDFEYFKKNYPDIHLINMGTNDVESVFKEIQESEFVFSCSLHGIIFAHSFQVPSIHLEKNFIGSKNDFKFKDYYSILNIEYVKEKFNNSFDFVNKYLENKKSYIPDKNIIENFSKEFIKILQKEII